MYKIYIYQNVIRSFVLFFSRETCHKPTIWGWSFWTTDLGGNLRGLSTGKGLSRCRASVLVRRHGSENPLKPDF